MDNLNKQQVVLVALLASFVTSIATGIITATLMEQAPPAVVQTINRVVERTIEQVVQVPEKSQTAAAVVTKETIVIKEDDQIIKVVEKNEPALAKFISQTLAGESSSRIVAVGAIVRKDGLIAVYKPSVNSEALYNVRLFDGKVYPVKLVYDHSLKNILIYKIVSDAPLVFEVTSMADSDTAKLGQSVVLLGGEDENSVVEGMVSSLSYEEDDNLTPVASTTVPVKKVVDGVTVNFKGKSNIAGLVLSLAGETVGYKADTSEAAKIIPSNYISQAMAAYAASLREPTESL